MFTSVERKLFAFSFCLALLFAVFTNHLWEDYYITYRASKNLATGKGLVFTEGQRVHSFTSPLGVLLPAACSLATLNRNDEVATWLFRLITCTFFGGTTVLLYRIGRRTGWGKPACLLALGLFVFDAKTVDYTINGMETGLLVFFLALTLYAQELPGKERWKWLGGAWAGLMWTRPDSFLYVGGLTLGYLMFTREGTWRTRFKRELPVLVKASLLTTALYLPWLLWAWSYYGSPIPHTIIAKGLGKESMDLMQLAGRLLHFPWQILAQTSTVTFTYAPAYPQLAPWPAPVKLFFTLLPIIPAFYWLVPGGNPTARTCSLSFLIFHFYLSSLTFHAYPWYMPGSAFLGIIALSDLFHRVWVKASENREPNAPARYEIGRLLLRTTMMGMVGLQFLTLGCVAMQMRIQQQVIELGVRKQIGLWLKDHAKSTADTVFLEPLGYIGYFSQLKMLDWPGLSSPEVVAARRKLGLYGGIDLRALPELKPDWLVLRPGECSMGLSQTNSYLRNHYSPVLLFDATPQVDQYPQLPGRDYLYFDAKFMIFKKTGPSNATTPNSPVPSAKAATQ